MAATRRETPVEIARLGGAVRKHAAAAARYHAPNRFHKAIVRGVEPLVVELPSAAITLDADNLLLTDSVRKYDRDHSLRVGDTVLVLEDDDDFIVTDVVSAATEDFAGPVIAEMVVAGNPTYSGPDPQGGTQTVTPSHNIIRKIPVVDEDGATVGWLPVYASLPNA